MNKSRITLSPKEVDFISDSKGRILTANNIDISPFQGNLDTIVSCITNGTAIPEQYYRQTIGRDTLLEELGWIHLHIGYGIDDNVLLFVSQSEHVVVFVILADHRIFSEEPVGKSIRGLKRRVDQKIAAAVPPKPKPVIEPPQEPPDAPAPPKRFSTRLTLPKKPTDESAMRNWMDIIQEALSWPRKAR